MSRTLVIIAALLSGALCSAVAGVPAKRFVVQLRRDNGELVQTFVVTASPRHESLAPIELIRRAAPPDAPSLAHWYLAGVFRLGAWKTRAFTEIAFGGQWDKYRNLLVRDLRDGDVIILHYPYAKA